MKNSDLLRPARLTLFTLLALVASFEAAQTLGSPRDWPTLPAQSLVAAIGLIIVLRGARLAVLALAVALADAGLASQAFQFGAHMLHEPPGWQAPIVLIWACTTTATLWLSLGGARSAFDSISVGAVTGLTIWLVAVAGHEATQIRLLTQALTGIALATLLRLAFDFSAPNKIIERI